MLPNLWTKNPSLNFCCWAKLSDFPCNVFLCTVFYPTDQDQGAYTPVLFISGLKGMVYPAFYSMANLASYGYVVAGIDPYWPVEMAAMKKADKGAKKPIGKSDAEKSFELFHWVCNILTFSLHWLFLSSEIFVKFLFFNRRGTLTPLPFPHHSHTLAHCFSLRTTWSAKCSQLNRYTMWPWTGANLVFLVTQLGQTFWLWCWCRDARWRLTTSDKKAVDRVPVPVLVFLELLLEMF